MVVDNRLTHACCSQAEIVHYWQYIDFVVLSVMHVMSFNCHETCEISVIRWQIHSQCNGDVVQHCRGHYYWQHVLEFQSQAVFEARKSTFEYADCSLNCIACCYVALVVRVL